MLAEKCTALFIDMDEMIESRSGKTITEIFRSQGEGMFRVTEKEVLNQLVKSCEDLVVATGGGTACFFDNMEVMNKNGTTVYLKFSPGLLFERLRDDMHHRPLLAEQKDLKKYIAASLAEREKFYHKAQYIIQVSSRNTDEDICKIILESINYKKKGNL